MDKNRIEGRYGTTSWHNTAKSSGMPVEVNAVVVQGSIVPLPGPTSPFGLREVSEENSSLASIARRATEEGHGSWRNEPECEEAQQNCRKPHPTKG